MKKTLSLVSSAFLISISLLIGCKKDETPTQRTLTLQPGADGKDAGLWSCSTCGYDTRNFGNSVEMDAIAWTNSGNESDVRSLINFDLSPINSNATIVSAKLSLYAYNSLANGEHSGLNASVIQKVTSAWDETLVTWATQPTTTDLNQIALAASDSATQNYIDIDVKNLVSDLVKNPSQNFGLMLKLQAETAYSSLIFASSDNADATKHPKLVVVYKQ